MIAALNSASLLISAREHGLSSSRKMKTIPMTVIKSKKNKKMTKLFATTSPSKQAKTSSSTSPSSVKTIKEQKEVEVNNNDNKFEFEVPNQYGYFPSVIEKAKIKRLENANKFDTDVYLSKEEQTLRFERLCTAHPENKKCQDGYKSPLRTKPSTTSRINGSIIRSDGNILIPGNKEDLVTWVLDPAMSADTIGILLPTLFVIIGAQLKKAAGVPEWVSGGVAITTKIIATCLIALYWIPLFMKE
jgi:hypothetical protein